jgi:hypothetical protein
MEKGWSLKKNNKREGKFHNVLIGIKIPEAIYVVLQKEGEKRGMKPSTFARLILEKGLEVFEREN